MQSTFSRFFLALVSVGVATSLRWVLDPVLGDQFVSALYLAAVAVAAWFGGLRPALVALGGGWLAADWFFVEPRGSLTLLNPDHWFAVGIYAIAGSAIVACIEGVRRSRNAPVTVTAAPSELRVVAEAVRQHGINSRELASYLDGLNASPASFMAAAKYEDFDLDPDELAARLEALVDEEQHTPLGAA